MKNKLILTTLSLAILTVFTTAIDCGCQFAHAAVVEQVQTEASNHCGGENETTPVEQKSDECCIGCVLENATPISDNLLIANQASGDFASKLILLAKSNVSPYVVSQPDGPPKSKYDSRGVPESRNKQQIYIDYGSLIV